MPHLPGPAEAAGAAGWDEMKRYQAIVENDRRVLNHRSGEDRWIHG
jgi:hypothetical protein